MRKAGEAFLVLLGLVVIWAAVKYFAQVPDYFLPSPAAVCVSLWQNHTLLAQAFLSTFGEALLGFMLALSLALALGFLAYYSALLRRVLYPLVLVSQALPLLVIAPLMVLWLGFGWEAKLALIVLALFFPILASFMAGLDQVKPLYLDLAATMHAKKWPLFRKVIFPSALPYLASGLKVAITWSVLSAMIAEWVGGSNGLGFVMQNALSRLDVALLFAALWIVIVSTLVLYALFSRAIIYYIFWVY